MIADFKLAGIKPPVYMSKQKAYRMAMGLLFGRMLIF